MQPLAKNDPQQIGPYRLIARLGSGGMGVVFLGISGVRRVAVKTVRNSFLDDPSLRSRFLREIETLKRISSPYVARFIDASADEELLWHAVEFVNGPSLGELITAEGPLTESSWFELAEQLKEALEAIHEAGIIHRDIKPSNVIMSDKGMRLIDFGISQDLQATSLTATGLTAGSPAWLSPEQLEGREVSGGSDLFSTGSLLIYAATGRGPWGEDSEGGIAAIYKRRLTSPPDLSGMSDRQTDLVKKLMLKDPNKRCFSVTSGFPRQADAKQGVEANRREDGGRRSTGDEIVFRNQKEANSVPILNGARAKNLKVLAFLLIPAALLLVVFGVIPTVASVRAQSEVLPDQEALTGTLDDELVPGSDELVPAESIFSSQNLVYDGPIVTIYMANSDPEIVEPESVFRSFYKVWLNSSNTEDFQTAWSLDALMRESCIEFDSGNASAQGAGSRVELLDRSGAWRLHSEPEISLGSSCEPGEASVTLTYDPEVAAAQGIRYPRDGSCQFVRFFIDGPENLASEELCVIQSVF